jgi:hypothetical protein
MKGVWIDQFEGSQFLLGATDASGAEVGMGGTWLDVETNRIPGLFQEAPVAELRALKSSLSGDRPSLRASMAIWAAPITRLWWTG